MRVTRWATHKLRRGDLTALLELAAGSEDVEEDRKNRLQGRGFIVKRGDGVIAITMRGWVALMMRRVLPH